jgi:hypothetical protein
MVRDRSQHTIGKERAALFRHYRVVARKQRLHLFGGRVKRGNAQSMPALHPDNGR